MFHSRSLNEGDDMRKKKKSNGSVTLKELTHLLRTDEKFREMVRSEFENNEKVKTSMQCAKALSNCVESLRNPKKG